MIEVNGNRIHTLDLGGFNELRFGRDGLYLYNKNDRYVGASLKIYGEYAHAEAVMLQHLITPESTVIEIGANLGSHTVGLARRAKVVHAFEPQRLMFQLLCANLALNQAANAFAYQCGIGARECELNVPLLDPTATANFGGQSLTLEKESPDARYERVAVRPLDHMDLGAPTLIKIDVEGMELDVIKGAVNTIGAFRPTLYMENDRREKSAELCDAMWSLGYALYWHFPPLFNPRNHARETTNVFPKVVSVNMLCRPNAEDEAFGLTKVTDTDYFWKGVRVTE